MYLNIDMTAVKSLNRTLDWIDRKRTSSDEVVYKKYGVITFKSKYGKYSVLKNIIFNYVRECKKFDKDVIVMEDVDDNLVKTWVVGNKYKINQMVNDSLKKQF